MTPLIDRNDVPDGQNPADTAPGVRGPRGPRRRAVLVGLLAVIPVVVLVTQAEMAMPEQSTVRVGYMQFPPVAFGLLMALIGMDLGLKRLCARWGLAASDLLVIYSMMLVAALVSSHGVVEKWIPLLIGLNYFSNPGNHWFSLYTRQYQPRMFPFDTTTPAAQPVSTAYYERLPHNGLIPWHLWVVPLMTWGCLILLVLFAFLCLTAILRRQWVENEKLTFPLAQIPLEMVNGRGGGLYRDRLLWLGVAVPVVIYAVKEVHQISPSSPDISLGLYLNEYLVNPPWNQVSCTPCFLSFAALGVMFLLPVDILFSVWFFFLATRVEEVIAITHNMGMPYMPMYNPRLFIGYQTVGAYFVLVGSMLVAARPHLSRVWASVMGRAKIDDSEEILPYRTAVIGLCVSVIASALWLWGMGMSLWLAFWELLIVIFVIGLVMARSTAEGGMLMTETTFRPIDVYRMFAPLHSLGPTNLAMLALVDGLFTVDQRGLLLTGLLDAARISDGGNLNRRSFFRALAAGVLLALAIAVPLNIYLPYHIGALRMNWGAEQSTAQITFTQYAPYFSADPATLTTAAWQMPVFFCVGAVVSLLLVALHMNFAWWPFHPLGYALSNTWTTMVFWLPCLLAWGIKATLLRFGGAGLYHKTRPFFLGLVVGECGMGVLLCVLSVVFQVPPCKFPWP